MPEIKDYLLPPSGPIPNNSRFPLLVYASAFPVNVTSSRIRDHFHANHWGNSWVNGVFSYHHFHSNAHEVLGCFSGEATIRFGGEDGPAITLTAGDAVLIPAGVGHKKLTATSSFGVVGAYPAGSHHDLCTGEGDPDTTAKTIASIPPPSLDPLTGKSGGVCELWKNR